MQRCEEVRENFPHYAPTPHTPGKRFCECAGVPGKGEVDKDTRASQVGGEASKTLRREGWPQGQGANTATVHTQMCIPCHIDRSTCTPQKDRCGQKAAPKMVLWELGVLRQALQCSPNTSKTHSHPPVSASQGLRLQAQTTELDGMGSLKEFPCLYI